MALLGCFVREKGRSYLRPRTGYVNVPGCVNTLATLFVVAYYAAPHLVLVHIFRRYIEDLSARAQDSCVYIVYHQCHHIRYGEIFDIVADTEHHHAWCRPETTEQVHVQEREYKRASENDWSHFAAP